MVYIPNPNLYVEAVAEAVELGPDADRSVDALRSLHAEDVHKAGRCKLDPSLKPPGFKTSTLMERKLAFNLKPELSSLRHYNKAVAADVSQRLSDRPDARPEERVTPARVVGRCELDPSLKVPPRFSKEIQT